MIWHLLCGFFLPHSLQLLPGGSHSEYLAIRSQSYQSNIEESRLVWVSYLSQQEVKISPLLFSPI